MENNFGFIGIPYDWGNAGCRPGARFGPEAVRKSLPALQGRIVDNKVYSLDQHKVVNAYADKFIDYGDVKRVIYDPLKMFANIEAKAEEMLKNGDYICSVGGDHSVTYPLIKALHDSCDDDIAILQFDGHLDLIDEEEERGRYSHSSPFRRSLELPRVKKLVQVGIRGYNYPSFDKVFEDNPIVQLTSYQVHEMGANVAAEKIFEELEGFKKVYISICIDGFDPTYAPACSWEEPFGLTPHQVLTILKKIFPISCGFDICEVTPIADPNGRTASMVARLIFDDFICQCNK